jgi:hypothetical protein
MTIPFLIDRTYWAVIVFSPLGYALLNARAFERTGKRFLLYLLVIDLALFTVTLLMFLIRYTDVVRSNIHHIQMALSVILIVRVPIHMFLYSKLLEDVPVQLTAQEKEGSLAKE